MKLLKTEQNNQNGVIDIIRKNALALATHVIQLFLYLVARITRTNNASVCNVTASIFGMFIRY